MEKSLKISFAYAVHNPENSEEFLIIERPARDEGPGVWGLPAGTISHEWPVPSEEDYKHAIRESSREKLGIEVEVGHALGEDFTDKRKRYDLHMTVYEAFLLSGTPNVNQDVPKDKTKYVGWKWSLARNKDLIESARAGGLCCKVFLETYGVINFSN